MGFDFIDIHKDEIFKIEKLWEKLNKIHLKDSVYWKDHYRDFTFEKRMAFIHKYENDDIKITLICNDELVCGYCISTVDEYRGEIDSLYLDELIRNKKMGKEIVTMHLNWLKEKNCHKIIVSVAHGHESVLKFYNKQGFYERKIELEYKPKFHSI